MKKRLLFACLLFFYLFPLPMRAEGNNTYPEIASEAAILMDTQSGAVLYQKNAHQKMVPASLTKIATAIYAIEHGDLNDIVTISKEVTEVIGTRVYLVEGEQVTLKQLLQGMLINSGNDAALAIALHLDGNEKAFSKRINQYLQDTIGVSSTHFTNPHGLYDENHYTTAHDLAVITNYAMKNPVFKEIFGTIELDWDGQEWKTTLMTHHLLLKGDYRYEGITGGKTGFVSEAKQTLATTAEKEELKLTAIVLKADYKKQIYQDTAQLLDYGFQNYHAGVIKKDTVYHIGKTTFIADKDIPITLPKEGCKETVTPHGLLQLYNMHGDLLQTVVLKEENGPKFVEALQIDEQTKYGNTVGTNNIFIIILFLSFIALYHMKKWMDRV